MKGSRRKVIVCGDTLILQGVRASLVNCPALEVVVDQPPQSSPEQLAAYCPAAVIFDTSVVQPQLLLGLFQQPGLLLIGMNSETHQALVWSGRQAAAVDAADLVRVLIETGNGSVTPS